MTSLKRRLKGLVALTLTGAMGACGQAPSDVMAPTGTAGGALTGPLHTVTLITPDWQPMHKLFVRGMGLTDQGLVQPPEALAATQRALWGIPEDVSWQLRVLNRPAAPGTIQLRVLLSDQASEAPRRTWDRRELGPYGMGFPTLDVYAWDEELRELGFQRATPEVEVFQVAAPDGGSYAVHEAAFFGPESLRVIAISRKGGLPQVGVYDPESQRGGPVYATQIVPDADAMIEFFTRVLDMEVRSDRQWREYPEPFRFTLVHARGSQTGHIALVEYEQQYVIPGTGAPPRPPARGMSMWSFPVTDIKAIEQRAEDAGVPVQHGPIRYNSPSLGTHTALTLVAPNGFMVEVFQQEDP